MLLYLYCMKVVSLQFQNPQLCIRYIKFSIFTGILSVDCVICKVAVHDIGIHTAQYMFAILRKLHCVPCVTSIG